MNRRMAAPAALPPLFVAFSGSGFVGARLGLPHAEPFIFLGLRFALAAATLAGIAHGVPPAVSALILALHPILVALVAYLPFGHTIEAAAFGVLLAVLPATRQNLSIIASERE